MQPTFGAIINDARDYLGDEKGSVFKTAYLMRWLCRALDEMATVFGAYQLPSVIVISAPITVAAGTDELDPADTVGLENLSEPQFLEERTSGSGDKYIPIQMVDVLPQRDPSDKLRQYTFRGGKFQFVAASADVELRAHYFSSGNYGEADKDAVIAVDDCRNFLAAATAAKAAPGKGYTEEANRAKTDAYGANNINPLAILGGYLEVLVNKQLRVLQQTPIQPAMYRAGQFRR